MPPDIPRGAHPAEEPDPGLPDKSVRTRHDTHHQGPIPQASAARYGI
jgi:hypothetical protein